MKPPPRPVTATVESSLTVSAWPCGQLAGSPDSVIGRLTSKVSPQARQRNSYRGMPDRVRLTRCSARCAILDAWRTGRRHQSGPCVRRRPSGLGRWAVRVRPLRRRRPSPLSPPRPSQPSRPRPSRRRSGRGQRQGTSRRTPTSRARKRVRRRLGRRLPHPTRAPPHPPPTSQRSPWRPPRRSYQRLLLDRDGGCGSLMVFVVRRGRATWRAACGPGPGGRVGG